MLDGKGWLLPVAVDELYVHGDVDRAVKEGAEKLYGIDDAAYTWADTIRYMSINHEVRPAEYALRCLDCHGPDGRLDWVALGYAAGDPMESAWVTPSRLTQSTDLYLDRRAYGPPDFFRLHRPKSCSVDRGY